MLFCHLFPFIYLSSRDVSALTGGTWMQLQHPLIFYGRCQYWGVSDILAPGLAPKAELSVIRLHYTYFLYLQSLHHTDSTHLVLHLHKLTMITQEESNHTDLLAINWTILNPSLS